MSDLNGFNANEVEPAKSFDPVPAGDYTAIITESEMKPTKGGDGERLALTLQIVDGPYEGRKLFDGLNLKNPSEKAVEIARATLSSICRAVGKMTPKASEELHNIPISVKVAIKPASGDYDAQNVVKGYKALGAPTAPATPAAAAPANGGGKKAAPWAAKKS